MNFHVSNGIEMYDWPIANGLNIERIEKFMKDEFYVGENYE